MGRHHLREKQELEAHARKTFTELALVVAGGGLSVAVVAGSSPSGSSEGGNASPWGPLGVECDAFEADSPEAPHLLCLRF